MGSKTEVCKDVAELIPKAQIACRLFMAECGKQGLNVKITETYRSQERQNYLYEQGRTRPGTKVTWTKNSRHTSRRAWDICKNVKGDEYSDKAFFASCGKIAQKLGITWGGTWKQADTPHFEISENWTETKEENEMTEAERTEFNALAETVGSMANTLDKLADRITKLEHPMIYNYIDENMPQWAETTVQKLVNKGIIAGDGDGLSLNDDMLRILVMIDRSGIFDNSINSL